MARAGCMSRSKRSIDELPLEQVRSVRSLTEAELVIHALRMRQCGLSPRYADERAALEKFDSLDLAGKRAMLGEFWPKWRDLVESGAV